MTEEREFDIVCIGRAAVDLYSDQYGASLEDASTFSKYVGGCPANIAIGTSRLGLHSAMLTRVGNEAMGRFVRETLDEEGVDISHVTTDPDRLTGLVLLGVKPPDEFPLIFYRRDCADMAIDESDISAELISQSKALLITGTHFSTEQSAAVSRRAVALAKESGTRVILDIDFRPVLWGLTGDDGGDERYVATNSVHERLKSVLEHCDLIVGTEEELRIAASCEEIGHAITSLRTSTSATIVRKRGSDGCTAYPPQADAKVSAPGFPIKVLNTLGAGDAFLSGFLRGWLRDESLETSCQWGNACGALVAARHGCSPAIPYWDELQHYLSQPEPIQSMIPLNRVHRSISHCVEDARPLCILAIDHRLYFKTLMTRHHRNHDHVRRFKNLLYEAVLKTLEADIPVNQGIIVDEEYGSDILRRLNPAQLWCARCIEAPGSYPLNFLRAQEASTLLRHWPRDHVVKVLTVQPPLEDSHTFQIQVQRLRQLNEACTTWGHQLVVEIIPHYEETTDPSPVEAIETYYRAGIHPTWWKLMPNISREAWNKTHALIQHYDPHCRGILLLGKSEPLEVLEEVFSQLETVAPIKGFAIGRSIWGHAAGHWFAGTMADNEVVDEVAERYLKMMEHFTLQRLGV